jgi:hypothetical protein
VRVPVAAVIAAAFAPARRPAKVTTQAPGEPVTRTLPVPTLDSASSALCTEGVGVLAAAFQAIAAVVWPPQVRVNVPPVTVPV